MDDATMSFEQAQEYLDTVAESLPAEIFQGLNGGVVLLPQLMPSPHGQGLVVLGMYHNDPFGLGRYVAIYYGSFVRAHGGQSLQAQQQALAGVLRHELTHHVESLAGIRDLEYKDELFLEKYKKKGTKKENKRKRGG